jgi:DNA-binding transcriptional ArsR family regulator
MSPARSVAASKAADAVPVFAALADATRLRIVSRLCDEGPLSITRLSDGAGVTRQAVTKHLHALESAGLVRDARVGRERIFELEPRRLDKARRYLDHVAASWDARIDRLRGHVEG